MTSETRTVEQVRAELQLVRRRTRAFQTMASQSEQLERIVAYFAKTVGNTFPFGLREIFGANNAWAWQAADELARIQRLLGSPELVECPQSLGLGLQQLISQLRRQELALCRELAALEPPPEPTTLVLGAFWASLRERAHRLVWGARP